MKKIYSIILTTLSLCIFVGLNSVSAQAPDGFTTVDVLFSGGTFDEEISWQLVDEDDNVLFCQSPTSPAVVSVEVPNDQEISLLAWDSFGDGWNGASIDIVASEDASGYTNGCGSNSEVLATGASLGTGLPAPFPNAFGADCNTPSTFGGTSIASFTVQCVSCSVTCPTDIVVSNDGGECGAEVSIPLPTLSEACTDMVLSNTCEEFSGEGDLLYEDENVPGLGYLTGGSVDITDVPATLPGPLASIEVEICVSGDFGSFELEITPIFDENQNLVGPVGDELAGDCNTYCLTQVLTAAEYEAVAADGTISYSIGTNTFVSDICASQTITAAFCVPEVIDATLVLNDYNGTEDASDFYPVGVTEVTYTSQDVNGTPALCSFTVTVNDTEDPILDCPSNVTISLDAGDCEAVFTAAIDASDNCGIVATPTGDPVDLAGPFGTLEACAGNDGFSIACTGGNSSVVQEVDLSALNGEVAFLTEGCFIFDNAAWGLTTGTVRLYCTSGGAPPSFLTGDVPVASGTFNAGGANSGDAFCVAFDTPYLVDGSCGGTLWLEVDPNGTGGITFFGEECNGITADGTNTYLASTLCGSGFLNQFGFAVDAFFGYTAQPASFLAEADVPGANEFALGDALPIGDHLFAFEVSDNAGNVTSCQFTVTVNEYPEALQTNILSCNGSINISVDEACTVVLNADQFLEGGMYGCYESDYQINIWPFNNQSAAINDVGGDVLDFNGLLDAQHTYEIVDLDTGNKCWGNFVVEDKIAPTLACEDLTLQCTDPTDVGAIIPGGDNTYADVSGAPINNTLDPAIVEINAIGGAVTDLSLELDITHTWIGDLDIDLTSPAGTTVRVFDGQCGNTDNLVATFEDGAPGFNCAASADGATYAPFESFAAFNGEDASGTWILSVDDNVGGDNGVLNSFALNITDAGIVVGGAVASDNCDDTTLEFVETVEEGDCTDEFASVITRVWTATDGSGNVSESCTQTVNILRETLATLELPLNWDGLGDNNPVLECSDAGVAGGFALNSDGYPNPVAIGNQFGTGSPSGVGSCGTIISYYTDVILPICNETCSDNDSTYKVVRKWTILDWCTGEILEPTQIIKVMDTEAPVLSELPDITVGTDIWGCGATIPLPVAAATDNCSATITYEWSSTAGTYNAQNNTFVLADPAKTMIGAPVVVTATATDCCGNSSTASFNVVVQDQVPPVVVAETTRTVSLTTDGTAKIFAESFDDGSHDGCGPIGFSVKRMDNGSPCTSVYSSAENFDNSNFTDKVFFCCADTEPVMVQFRVCDDANMDGINNASDNCNTAMVEVIVQDKLAPVLIVPENTTVSCIDLAGIDLNDTDLLDALFGKATGAGTCNVTITQTTVGGSSCLAGTVGGNIFRQFTATNAAGTTGPITQTIAVLAGPDNVLTCNRIGLDTENPVFASLSTCAKDRFQNGPTEFACNNTQQRWWCAVNDGQNNNTDDIPALSIDCTEGFSVPEVIIDINGLCTEAGVNIEVDTFLFAGGACKKYLVHYEVIDQCIFDDNYVDPTTGQIDPFNSGNGYFELYLEIDAFDNDAPVLDCEPISVAATSCSGIDAEITIGATDVCTTDPAFMGYQWRLDAFNDNTIDFPASGWYSTDAATPGQVGLTEFPIGTHRFFWIVSDGCGNSETCSQLVTVTENEKEPTPYCFDGLSVAVMPSTGTVALWANDFNAGSFDNCPGELLFTMVPEQDVIDLSAEDAYDMSFDGVQNNGDYGWEFDCSYIENGISAVIEVRIYVTDVNGNWDYCTASLRIDDNFDACEDMTGTVTYSVTGKLQTEQGEDVADADVTVDANFPEFPMTETVSGTYAFDLIENIDYSIIPAKNDNHLNGVTTLDIVMIQKHILGLDLLDSPYQLIAADVNNDCNVTGSDLVQVRKLILGKYPNEQFPSNDSWRFVEADYNFTNPEAPCNFSEVSEIFNLTAAEINDFVATKIGDVNGTAQANAAMTADVRSTENLEFVVVDQTMAAGSNRIEVLAKDFNEVYGFQYTMNFNNVEFVSVEAGALNVTDNNFGLNANGNLLVSFDDANGVSVADDAVLFTIVLNASNNTLVSNAISMNSNGVAAEAYIGRNLEVLGSDVVFRTNEGEVAANAFSLFQNEPNPFNGATVVGFELPATAEATLSVYDVTGKVLYTKVDTYTKGYNTVTLNRDELTATGVLYYKLESGNNVATMKMIIID